MRKIECEKRHPVVCKYYRNFRKCKFLSCAYKHETQKKVNKNDEKQNDIKKNFEKIKEIERKLDNIENRTKDKPIEPDLARHVENRLEVFENQIKTMRKALKEKDAQISGLEMRLEELDKKSKDSKKVNNKKFKDHETIVKNLQKKSIWIYLFRS